MNQHTFRLKPEEIERKWYLIDAKDKVLGRLATRISHILQGKNKPYYSKDIDCGDFVVVLNAGKIKLTGKKLDTMFEYRHSGYPHGYKFIPYKKLIEKNPSKIIQLAVKGMLPKNKLRSRMLKRLKVYPGENHNNIAQKPIKLEI